MSTIMPTRFISRTTSRPKSLSPSGACTRSRFSLPEESAQRVGLAQVRVM